jgi:hypothetical protein
MLYIVFPRTLSNIQNLWAPQMRDKWGLKVSYTKTNRIHMYSTSSYEAFVNCAIEGCELLENQLDRVLQ